MSADRVYVEGHEPAPGWRTGPGRYHAACSCGAESGPQPSERARREWFAGHELELAESAGVVIEQDAVEVFDHELGEWPEANGIFGDPD